MHNPTDVIGKTALYFEKGNVPYVTRVMVTKHIGNDQYIVSDFNNPRQYFETTGKSFTIEKDAEQPEQPMLDKYLAAYEKERAGA